MPIPRRFDRRPPERDQTRVNERIRVPEVRLIGEDGNQVGVISRDDALAYAQQRDLDLVEVAAEARPPVVRVLDYSKYKYEQEQKAKAAKRHQKNINVREIKLRPKIAENDYSTKKGHVTRFLKAQDKVKVTIMFRGREMTHPERGERLLLRLAEDIQELGTVEQRPTQDGRNMIMMLAPVKARVEADADGSPDDERARVGESAAKPAVSADAPLDTAAAPAEGAAAGGPTGPVADGTASAAADGTASAAADGTASAAADGTASAAADGTASAAADGTASAAADGTASASETAQTPLGAPADTATAPPVAAGVAPAAPPVTRDAAPASQGAVPAPTKPAAPRKRASNAASPAPVVEGVASGEDAGAVDPPAAPATGSGKPARRTPAAKGSAPKATPARKGKGNGGEPPADAVEIDPARAAS